MYVLKTNIKSLVELQVNSLDTRGYEFEDDKGTFLKHLQSYHAPYESYPYLQSDHTHIGFSFGPHSYAFFGRSYQN